MFTPRPIYATLLGLVLFPFASYAQFTDSFAANREIPADERAEPGLAKAASCPAWDVNKTYDTAGTVVSYGGVLWRNKWYTKGGQPPGADPWGPWERAPDNAVCGGGDSSDDGGCPAWQAQNYPAAGTLVSHSNKVWRNKWWANSTDVPGQADVWAITPAGTKCGGNSSPTIRLDSPAAGASYAEGTVITLAATASDADGSVAKVEFFLDGASLGTDTSSPYSLNWTAKLGNHTVHAVATDDKGASSTTATTSFSVLSGQNQSPTIALTSPAAGSSFTTGATVTFAANASDADGTVAKVDFFLDGQLLATDSTSPYSATWTATAGSHQLYARATDNAGAATSSQTLTFTVSDGTGASCRPDGLVATPGTQSPYCTVYDANGREKMGADHPRRIIGYFTGWRHGKDGKPAYLASDIPWSRITHINYAFAHIDGQNRISVGNESDPNNPATGMSWPGVAGAELDPALPYRGHFNLLTRLKRSHPQVKTLISVGGWAETGGYFETPTKRVNSGGFYTLTTHADLSVNQPAIDTFANSVVEFLRRYSIDGVDIDYEYPTSMMNAGNPEDFAFANPRRSALMRGYEALMKTLRAKLDAAGQTDGKHYLLTAAIPTSAYLLRGMEAFPVTGYLDYVNLMSYDLHGAWNQYVGPNAAVFDTGQDGELAAWGQYTAAQYGKIGTLNADWGYHYLRGALPAGRINIGIPYYTRGWRDVTGGNNGLWGKAPLPDQSKCPAGTGSSDANKCGNGAVGIDNVWHDSDATGKEVAGGGNPLWHAKNLLDGRAGSYIGQYGLDPANDATDRLTGTYTRHFDNTAIASWLWNDSKKVFLSTEDESSVGARADYIAAKGIGGAMIWELAGDYRWNASRNEYYIGDALTTLLYDRLKGASPYGATRAGERTMPSTAVDVRFEISGFAEGDANFPISPTLKLINNTGHDLAPGTEFSFDVPTAVPDSVSDWNGMGVKVVESGANAGGGNVGGLVKDFHRVAFRLPSWQKLANGQSMEFRIVYQLPMTTPSNWTVQIGNSRHALKQEHPELPTAQ